MSGVIQPFCDWLISQKPLFGSILETHIKDSNMNYLINKLCRDWNYTSNHASDEDGRIVIIWKPSVFVRVLHQSAQSLTCEVKIPGSSVFVYTAIYASNLRSERTDLWVDLLNIHQSLDLHSTPWMVGGDFNQILHPAEHSIQAVNSFSPQMLELRDTLIQLELFDLRFHGPTLTWSNHQPDSPIAKKLDRLLITSPLLDLFPNCTSLFLPPIFSDHCPCIVDLAFKIPTSGTKPFKFYNYLTKHPDFHQLVQQAWNEAGSNLVTNLTDLCWKQKQIKRELKLLNKNNFSQIQKRVSEANLLLQDVQVQSLQNPSTALFEKERELLQKWQFLRIIEECYYKQRSRIDWLKEGDQNTAYFFRVVQARLNYNAIRSFFLPSGVLILDQLQMSVHAVNHFQSILGPLLLPPLRLHSPPAWFRTLSSFI